MLRIIILSICLSNLLVLNAEKTTTKQNSTTTLAPKQPRILKDSKISHIQLQALAPKQPRKFKDSKISHIQPYISKSIDLNHHNDRNLYAMKPRKSPKLNARKIDGGHHGKTAENNAELFSKLGLSKLKVPPSHHRKRLAVESRHHGRPDDSHMFVIKLPPNPYYYTNPKPIGENKNSISDNSKKVPVGFKSNGKPGRIYHWNIPVLKKMFGTQHNRNPNSRHTDDDDFFDIKDIPTWTKPWDNEAMDKQPFGKLTKEEEKILKKKSPTYYAPKPRKTNFHNYFPGNGKPQSFYVMEKSHKPAYYQKLIP